MPKKFIKKRLFYLSIISLSIIFILISGIFLSNLVPANVDSIKSSSFSLFYLCVTKTEVKKEAENKSGENISLGGGGYIFSSNDVYFVASSAYQNESDAKRVQTSILNNLSQESFLYEKIFPSISFSGNFSSSQSKIISSALDAFKDYYESIYDITVSLDTGLKQSDDCVGSISICHGNLQSAYLSLASLKLDIFSSLENALSLALEASEKLCKYDSSLQISLSSLAKSTYFIVLECFDNLTDNM